ncbi:MAG: phosphatase PAP2 family protein [Thermoleophilia bacterium]|nr:phosphatase PAP2 family protein [Thermoleophilia bacterium]
MSSPEIASAVLAADRRAGREVRDRVRALPAGHESARLAADAMAPAFQALVLSLLLLPGSRLLAVRAAAAGAAAGLVARVARDAIDRPRPGGRTEGGFPSRHAASSTAIAMVVARQRPVLGAVARMMAVTGMAARVAAADHDPLDVVAGAGLGAAVARVMRRRGRRRSGTRR